jgi:2'-hydroxyisoflavone reductase
MTMHASRRDLFKAAALGAMAAALPSSVAAAAAGRRREGEEVRCSILILGGTGFTGPFQVNYALARGHKVTLFNRGKRPSPEWPARWSSCTATARPATSSRSPGREWDVCIDNPTSIPSWVRDAGQVLKGKVGHYLFISTISVYADGSKPGITEDQALAVYRARTRWRKRARR